LATPKHSDLNEDPIHEQLEYALAWTMKHRNTVAAVAAVLVLAVAGSSFYLRLQSKREDDASTAFLNGLSALNEGRVDAARGLFTELVEERTGTSAARNAGLYLAHSLLRMGEHDAAEAAYQSYLGSARDDYLRLSAREGIAACAEDAGDWGNAAAAYTTIAAEHAAEADQARNLMAAARCKISAGDPAGARAIYLDIEERFEVAAVDARVARALLGPVGE